MIPKIRKEELKYYGQWLQPVLPGTFWCHWYKAESLEKVLLDKPMHQIVFLNGHTLFYKSDLSSIAEILRRLLKNKKVREYTKDFNDLGKFYEKEHLTLLDSDKNYKTYLPELFRTYLNMLGLWSLTLPLADEVEKYIRSQWPKLSNDDLFELAQPIKPTWLQEQSREIESLSKKVKLAFPKVNPGKITEKLLKTKPSLYKQIIIHVEKFNWFGTHHWVGEPFTVAICMEQIKERLFKKPVNKNKRGKFSAVPKDIVNLMQTVSYWRTHSAELTSKVVFHSRPVLQSLARRWGISYSQLTYLSHIEISKLLKDKKLPRNYQLKIKSRQKGYGCILDKRGTENIFTGKVFNRELKSLAETKVKRQSYITGMVASKGKIVRARVCRVMAPSDFKNFKKGDVLVTNETTPDFVPLMKIASAIVTDVGGITSHAAVVSRELGVPCIIGTRFATKIFKNGDKIEVDTQNGVVKIL